MGWGWRGPPVSTGWWLHCSPSVCRRYIEFDDRWATWLSRRPTVAQYFDPFFVLAQPTAVGAALAAPDMAQVLASLPGFPSGTIPTPVAVPGVAGMQLSNLLAVGSSTEAMAVSTALRSHYAHPQGGGGPGPALALASFATTSQLTFW